MVNYFKQHIRAIRHTTNLVSILLTVLALSALAIRGLNMGLDFTGGMVTEVRVDSSLTHEQVVNVLKTELGDSTSVIQSGEEGRWVIRYPLIEAKQSMPNLDQLLQSISSQTEIISNSMVGAQVGQDLIDQGGLALLICVLCILGYLSFRFEWRLASGALLALLHDVILVIGFFAITQMEFNLTVFAAILAILGYSLNDSIIISDRIRELLVAKPNASIEEVNDQAVIATFSRTLVTSGTSLMTVAALWLMGGAPLQGFAIAMFIGIISGTWSSISIGTVLPEWLHLQAKHYQPLEVDMAP